MKTKKKCVCCGKEYERYYKSSKYCSVECFRKMPKAFSHMTLTKTHLHKLYFDKCLSFYKIEELTKTPLNTIRYWFKKWGFKARNLSEAQRGVLNHGYKDGIPTNAYRAYIRDKKQCKICKYDRIINIHHIIERKHGGTNELNNLITLCPNCHSLVHNNIIKINSINDWIDLKKKHDKHLHK